MPVTMTRINLIKGLGPVLQIAEGYTVDLPKDVTASWTRELIQPGPLHGLHPTLQVRVPSQMYIL